MILSTAQASLLPFGMAAFTAYHVVRGLMTGTFHARGMTIGRESDGALYWLYAYGLTALLGAFLFLGFKFLYIAFVLQT